jgi:hypothetical protein
MQYHQRRRFLTWGLLIAIQCNLLLCMTLLSIHLEDEQDVFWETTHIRRAQDTPAELDASLADDDASPLLPKRLITVFGTESSGSTFTATAIGIAAGVKNPNDKNRLGFRLWNSERNVEVQHISLPTGYGPNHDICKEPESGDRTLDMPVLLPGPCMLIPPRYQKQSARAKLGESTFPKACREEAGLEDFVVYPTRFFVNVTSHIQWYRERANDERPFHFANLKGKHMVPRQESRRAAK